MTQYALRYDDCSTCRDEGRRSCGIASHDSTAEVVHDGSWTCISDVIGSFHAAYTDEQRRVTGVLLSRETEDDEWKEVL